jgi:hypothetical protein
MLNNKTENQIQKQKFVYRNIPENEKGRTYIRFQKRYVAWEYLKNAITLSNLVTQNFFFDDDKRYILL